jgi:hypothetical protein
MGSGMFRRVSARKRALGARCVLGGDAGDGSDTGAGPGSEKGSAGNGWRGCSGDWVRRRVEGREQLRDGSS